MSMIIRIVFSLICLLLTVFPLRLQADEIDSSFKEIEPDEVVNAPIQMTQKQMNDLFGEDPYLGQTSYLQAPEAFSQIEK